MTEHLFVYGTLAPGRPNAHVLTDIPGKWSEATIRGELHPEGWGATQGYPAVIPGKEGGVVKGHLFTSDHLSEHWQRLDAFEGEEYERRLATATLADGATVQANVYALRRRD